MVMPSDGCMLLVYEHQMTVWCSLSGDRKLAARTSEATVEIGNVVLNIQQEIQRRYGTSRFRMSGSR